MKRLPILTLSIVLISMVSFFSSEIASVLIFDRQAILRGEIWRLFSSHLVHFTRTHLVYNLFAFGIAGWIVERKSSSLLLFLYICMAPVMGMALLVFKPGMLFYGGLSGIACGLIYYIALLKMKEAPWKIMSRAIIICLPIKLVIELYTHASVLPYWEHQPFVIMPISHVAGVVMACLFYLGGKQFQKASIRPGSGSMIRMGL